MKKMKLLFLSGFLLVASMICNFAFANKENEVILPIKLTSQTMPYTSIEIQGHNIPLIFDSGASTTAITLSKDIVKKLNLKLVPTDKKVCVHGDTPEVMCLPVYIIPELKIGSMTMNNVPCQLMDKLWGGHYEGMVWFEAARNGVIGLDLLRQFNLLVDYKTSRAILSKLGEYPYEYDIKNWLKIPMLYKHGIGIAMNTKVNGIDTMLVWDTGANNSIMSANAMVSKSVKTKSCAYKEDPNCKYFETTTFVGSNKQFPKTRFYVQEGTLPFDGLIGSSFFQEHPVFFDFKNSLIFIKP